MRNPQNPNDPANWNEYYPVMPSRLGSVQQQLKQVRTGNRVTIRPRRGPSLNCWRAPTGPEPFPVLKPAVFSLERLLTVQGSDLRQYEHLPGSWVLSLRGRATTKAFSADYGGTFGISPLVAQVTIGSGGDAHVIEVDAIRSNIGLPCADVSIDVGVSQIVGEALSGGAAALYESYEIVGILHRTLETGEAIPTRSVMCLYSGDTSLAVPAFAQSWCYVPLDVVEYANISALLSAPMRHFPGEFIGNPFAPPSAIFSESVTTEIFGSNARNHCFRPYQPTTQSVLMPLAPSLVDPTLALYPGTFVSRLGL